LGPDKVSIKTLVLGLKSFCIKGDGRILHVLCESQVQRPCKRLLVSYGKKNYCQKRCFENRSLL